MNVYRMSNAGCQRAIAAEKLGIIQLTTDVDIYYNGNNKNR